MLIERTAVVLQIGQRCDHALASERNLVTLLQFAQAGTLQRCQRSRIEVPHAGCIVCLRIAVRIEMHILLVIRIGREQRFQ